MVSSHFLSSQYFELLPEVPVECTVARRSCNSEDLEGGRKGRERGKGGREEREGGRERGKGGREGGREEREGERKGRKGREEVERGQRGGWNKFDECLD